MELSSAVLESWDRQARISKAAAERVNETNEHLKPSEDGWPLYQHLVHMHRTRIFHLRKLDEERAEALDAAYAAFKNDPKDVLNTLRHMLDDSALAVREALQNALEAGGKPVVGYDHPIFFLEHLVFHEGWHIGLMFLALRLAGEEPPEAWEESRIWGEWRTD